jgi:hypothetical protein
LIYISFEVFYRLAYFEAFVQTRAVVNPGVEESVVKESAVLVYYIAVFIFDDEAVFQIP